MIESGIYKFIILYTTFGAKPIDYLAYVWLAYLIIAMDNTC
mgnify:CR=1 FL=1